ncbi:putative lipoprotein [Artemisia annua]|uniref:Putative lipoprotein n=1 Tax=Artemisia annua TaxID=35608 RepID=A0A2U1QN83_ARTAN|nr:putative lipoprotein [Artemisia annua]
MVSVLYTAAQTGNVKCHHVRMSYYSCVKYLREGGTIPPAVPLCCDGLRIMVKYANTTLDRVSTCSCLQSLYKSEFRDITPDKVVGMAASCRVNMPYLSPTADCSNLLSLRVSLHLDCISVFTFRISSVLFYITAGFHITPPLLHYDHGDLFTKERRFSGKIQIQTSKLLPRKNPEVRRTFTLGIDLLAGVEAIISHLVVKNFRIPCAHAPALLPPPLTQSLCPKSAAEELGHTFLPCVLAGLANAPEYLISDSRTNGCIVASDVDSVILPADACGGDGVLAFANKKTKASPLLPFLIPLIICVQENETVLNDTPEKLGIDVIKVSNYWEAIGVVAAHKAGVDPNSLRRDKIKNITKNPLIHSNGFVASSSTRTFA